MRKKAMNQKCECSMRVVEKRRCRFCSIAVSANNSHSSRYRHHYFSDQFEFTIASLVVLGKITADDVRPILEKFQRLTGDNPNKITSSDVTGPNKKKEDLEEEGVRGDEKETFIPLNDVNEKDSPLRASSTSSPKGALSVGKKIAQAFREEILSSGTSAMQRSTSEVDLEEKNEVDDDYSNFCIPKNTHAIAIDDSKIQRKLLTKLFSFADIPPERCTIVGDGYDEIMVSWFL